MKSYHRQGDNWVNISRGSPQYLFVLTRGEGAGGARIPGDDTARLA